MIFDKIKVYLVRLGSLKGKVRGEILEKRMIENGAQPVLDITQADIVVSCKDVPESLIEQVVGSSFRGRVVDSKWITESISTGKRLDPQAFEIELHPSSPCFPLVQIRKKTRESSAYNEELANVFDHLESLVGASVEKKDRFRGVAYRKAASVIRNSPPIRSDSDVDEILESKLGPRTIEKVKEYMLTGHVKKEEFLTDDVSIKAKQELIGVWGIGPSKAAELVAQGIDSVQKLRDRVSAARLTANQKTGLEYYDELLSKMPREEVEEIKTVVESAKNILFGEDLELVLCGSYRRGAQTCSDVDLLLAWKEGANALSPGATVQKLVERLCEDGFLLDHFNKKNNHSIFLGICKLPGPGHSARRIDIKVWPREAFATALLHFTGSADFNRRLRLHAKRHGLKLSDLGLRNSQGNLLTFKTERQVFEALGVEWVPPEQRLAGAHITLTTPQNIAINACDIVTDISSSDESSD